jgi:hypothetical protein
MLALRAPWRENRTHLSPPSERSERWGESRRSREGGNSNKRIARAKCLPTPGLVPRPADEGRYKRPIGRSMQSLNVSEMSKEIGTKKVVKQKHAAKKAAKKTAKKIAKRTAKKR